MRSCIVFSVAFFIFLIGFSQEKKSQLQKTPLKFCELDGLMPNFHKEKRAHLRKLMKKNTVAFFFANPIQNRSNDIDYEYHQDPNFYYLTGIIDPNAVLVIFKEGQVFSNGIITNELIFVQKKDLKSEIWNGKHIGINRVEKQFGILKALTGDQFANFEMELSSFDLIYHINKEKPTTNTYKKDDLYSLKNVLLQKTYAINEKVDEVSLPFFMATLREIKNQEELILLRKAISITCNAQVELMKAIKPEMKEFQSEAIVEYVFKKNGAEHPGFPSILGAGKNSCVLHYNNNRKIMKEGELLLCDVGAEYHGYTADVARTFPVNGVFSREQRIIYNIVLKAQNKAIAMCKVGNKFWEPHDLATKIIAEELKRLGIIKEEYQVKKYFMHGTSHYLGLDVHDVGLYAPFKEGNVVTVEPGIYIPINSECDSKWWGIGVRIEDDILITEADPENLSKKAPRTIKEIEALMKSDSDFNF